MSLSSRVRVSTSLQCEYKGAMNCSTLDTIHGAFLGFLYSYTLQFLCKLSRFTRSEQGENALSFGKPCCRFASAKVRRFSEPAKIILRRA